MKQYGEKVARSDDAQVPVELWNSVLFETRFAHIAYSPVKHRRALEVLCNKFTLRIYTINVVKSFFNYIKKIHWQDWLSFYLKSRKQLKGVDKKRKRGWIKRLERYHNLRVDLAICMDGLSRVIQGS